jgi:hypothetical protein
MGGVSVPWPLKKKSTSPGAARPTISASVRLTLAPVGEHGDVARREAEAVEEDGAHGVGVVDADLQLGRRAGVVAPHQRGQHLLLPRLHCCDVFF